MKPYQYPDENDTITCTFIDTKSNTTYWGESEKHVLQFAIQALKTLSSPRLLDLGCGMGRLFSTFLPYTDSLTGVEPDFARYSVALETAHALSSSHLQVLHGYIHTVSSSTFDAVICSHIFQHIPFDMVETIMDKLSKLLPSGSLLFLTTTFTTQPQDRFTLEHKEGNSHIVETVSEQVYQNRFSENGILPVRIYSLSTIQTLCKQYGFTIEDYKGYHFSLAHMPKPYSTTFDDEKNATKDLQDAKDVLYIIRRN